MNRSIKYGLTALAIAALGVACNSNESASKSAQAGQGPAWTLKYQTKCAEGSDATSCIGAYALSLNADGTFDVGPGPQGQRVHGKIEAEDFKALTDATATVVDGTAAARAESCNGDFSSAQDYTLTLTKQGAASEVLHKAGADLCSTRLEAQPAESLHNLVIELADKYYPTPFPDACTDAAAATMALYPSVQSCHADAECGYVNADYSVIAKDSESQVYLDNCSLVSPLAAANISAIQADLAKLQAALEAAQQACGARIARAECSGPQSFSSSAAPAACIQGTCQVNPILLAPAPAETQAPAPDPTATAAPAPAPAGH